MLFGGLEMLVLIMIPMAVISVMAVVRSVTVPHGLRRGSICGGCGYAFSGLLRCPECGRDVADVGVLTPRLAMRLRGGTGAASVGLLFLAGVGCVATFAGAEVLAAASGYAHHTMNESLGTQALDPRAPHTASMDYEVTLVVDTFTANSKPFKGSVTVQLHSTPSSGRGIHTSVSVAGAPLARVDVRSGAVEVCDASGAVVGRYQEFDRACADALYQAAGLDTQDAFFAAGAGDLVSLVGAETSASGAPGGSVPAATSAPLSTVGSLRSQGTSTSSAIAFPFQLFGLSGDAALAVLTGGMWLVLYIASIAWVRRRRRRLLSIASRQARPPGAAVLEPRPQS